MLHLSLYIYIYIYTFSLSLSIYIYIFLPYELIGLTAEKGCLRSGGAARLTLLV